ncbi:TPA: hypothetical protein ACH3X1_014764 [Trebouxia sp. C0004]
MSQLISNPDQRFLTPLADAIRFRYGALLLLSPTQHKYYRVLQWALTLVSVARVDMVSSFTILLVMALWAVNYLVAADCAIKNMEPDEWKLVYNMAAQRSEVPWLLPVHRMLPSASLIAILLIIVGIEVNPGPVISFVLTLLMLVTMPTAKRTLRGSGDPDSESVAVLMSNNPFESKLRHADLTELLDSRYALRDPVVNFVLGMLQLESNGSRSKEWLILHTFFFEQLYGSNPAHADAYGVYMPDKVKSCFCEAKHKPPWSGDVPWYKRGKIFVPINIQDYFHWIAAVIDLERMTITSYDSLNEDNMDRMRILAQWLEDQSSVEPGTPKWKAADFSIKEATGIPLQEKLLDCGLFVIKYAQSLVRRQPMHFSQESMPTIRTELHQALQSMREHIVDDSSEDAPISGSELIAEDLHLDDELDPLQSPSGPTNLQSPRRSLHRQAPAAGVSSLMINSFQTLFGVDHQVQDEDLPNFAHERPQQDNAGAAVDVSAADDSSTGSELHPEDLHIDDDPDPSQNASGQNSNSILFIAGNDGIFETDDDFPAMETTPFAKLGWPVSRLLAAHQRKHIGPLMFSSFVEVFGLGQIDVTDPRTLVLHARVPRQAKQGSRSLVTAEHQHRWWVMAQALLAWKSTARPSALSKNTALWSMLESMCDPVRRALDDMQREECAGMKYDGMCEDVVEDHMDLDSPRPQAPEQSPGVSPMPSTSSEETYHGCLDSDSDSHSSNDTQTDEQCMENMLSDDDLADDVEQQTAEELREELREETGTINSPTRRLNRAELLKAKRKYRRKSTARAYHDRHCQYQNWVMRIYGSQEVSNEAVFAYLSLYIKKTGNATENGACMDGIGLNSYAQHCKIGRCLLSIPQEAGFEKRKPERMPSTITYSMLDAQLNALWDLQADQRLKGFGQRASIRNDPMVKQVVAKFQASMA